MNTHRAVTGAATVILLALLLSGCEQFFTSSPLEWAQRDPKNLPTEQKIAYAELALGSGDTEQLRDAYDAIKDINDPDVQYLASQVAVSASGINEAIDEALEDPDNIDVDQVLNDISGTWLDNAESSMADADDGNADISSEDYLTVAIAIVIGEAKDNGNSFPADVESDIDTATADKESANYQDRAKYYLDKSGYSSTDLDELLSLAGN